MQLLSHFDIDSDFYSDPQIKSIFSDEIKNKVSSRTMWALMLYYHPDSKYYALDSASKKQLIEKDYLKSTLDLEALSPTLSKIEEFLLTKPQRMLASWESKLEERDSFIKNQSYNEDSFEMLDKMMEKSFKMWQQYRDIYDIFLKDKETKTHGSVQESLTERGLI